MTPRPSVWPWRKPRPSRPNTTPAPPPAPSNPTPQKPAKRPKRKANVMSRSPRRRQPFWSVLLNICWPSWALWLLLAATQAGSLGYL